MRPGAVDRALAADEPGLLWFAFVTKSFAEFHLGCSDPALVGRILELEDVIGNRALPYRWSGNFLGLQLMCIGDFSRARAVINGHHRRAVDTGDETARWQALRHLAELEARTGDLNAAARYARDGDDIERAFGHDSYRSEQTYVNALAAALQGRVAHARDNAVEGMRISETDGDHFYALANRWVLGFLAISQRNWEDAAATLAPLVSMSETIGLVEPTLCPYDPDLIEAEVRCGSHDVAEAHLDTFKNRGAVLKRQWVAITAARCEALLMAERDDSITATALINEAVSAAEAANLWLELGRCRLVQGEIHRRQRQRQQARAALTAANEIFDRHGAALWSDSATAELRRIPGRRPRANPDDLTPTERQMVELVSAGHTNREVAAALFVSVHTVESTLRRIYRKLGVRSRTELAARAHEAPHSGPPVS